MKPRCGTCGRAPIRYLEYWTDHLIQFDAERDGSVDPGKEGAMGEGRPYAVVAVCQCGHEWRLRGVRQITELHPASPLPAQPSASRDAPKEPNAE